MGERSSWVIKTNWIGIAFSQLKFCNNRLSIESYPIVLIFWNFKPLTQASLYVKNRQSIFKNTPFYKFQRVIRYATFWKCSLKTFINLDDVQSYCIYGPTLLSYPGCIVQLLIFYTTIGKVFAKTLKTPRWSDTLDRLMFVGCTIQEQKRLNN